MCATQQATLRPSQRGGGHMNTDTRHVLSLSKREGTEGGDRRRYRRPRGLGKARKKNGERACAWRGTYGRRGAVVGRSALPHASLISSRAVSRLWHLLRVAHWLSIAVGVGVAAGLEDGGVGAAHAAVLHPRPAHAHPRLHPSLRKGTVWVEGLRVGAAHAAVLRHAAAAHAVASALRHPAAIVHPWPLPLPVRRPTVHGRTCTCGLLPETTGSSVESRGTCPR